MTAQGARGGPQQSPPTDSHPEPLRRCFPPSEALLHKNQRGEMMAAGQPRPPTPLQGTGQPLDLSKKAGRELCPSGAAPQVRGRQRRPEGVTHGRQPWHGRQLSPGSRPACSVPAWPRQSGRGRRGKSGWPGAIQGATLPMPIPDPGPHSHSLSVPETRWPWVRPSQLT